MKAKIHANVCAASVLVLGVAAFAQGAGPQGAQPQTQPGAQASTDQQITVTGCVQREADFRRARDAGRGGVAGTGVGAGNEFVLAEATAPSGSTAGARTTEPSSPTGTGGSSATGSMAFELTGPNEGQASQYVGRRVEITGKLKPAETDASGRATGGATAGPPPSGVDVASKDLKLRELEVASVRESTGTCAPIK
jgi:hypothetical protein